MGVQILQCKGAILREKGWPIVRYRDSLPWAVQKQLKRSSCHLGCWVGCVQGSICWGARWCNLVNTTEPSTFRVEASYSQHKGTSTPSFSNPVVDEERTKPRSRCLEFFSWTDLVGWQDGHPANTNNPCHFSPKVLFRNRCRKTNELSCLQSVYGCVYKYYVISYYIVLYAVAWFHYNSGVSTTTLCLKKTSHLYNLL